MFDPGSSLARLLAAPMRPGTIRWLGVRPARHADLRTVAEARFDPAEGLVGDHYAGRSGTRQVSLIQAEDLAAIAAHLGRDGVTPGELRRNVVVAGLNLLALKDGRFQLGSAVLAYTGPCHPCSRMEAILGLGGYNAVRGRGGIVARVLQAGLARPGDTVVRLTGDTG